MELHLHRESAHMGDETSISPAVQDPATTPHSLIGRYRQIGEAPPEGEFHIGLVLSGAVSAGAYSAGVIDYLVEALDAWEQAKRDQESANPDPQTWTVPSHQVKVRIMTGASAGSITAAIAAPALNYRFPHVSAARLAKAEAFDPATNPLWRAWVKDIGIDKLLGSADLADQNANVMSLLDGTVLETIGLNAIGYTGPSLEAPRAWLSQPLRLVFTLCNLRGTPYYLKFGGNANAGLGMVSHADYVSYCINYHGVQSDPLYQDDLMLHFPRSSNASNQAHWQRLAEAALGSGAFPFGLPARRFERHGADYAFRFVVAPDLDSGLWNASAIAPSWGPGGAPQMFSTMVVDGGVMNNEPIELARTELSGLSGRNPRKGCEADRAVVMVDPFADQNDRVDDPARGQQPDLINTLTGLMQAWKRQSRFKPVDIALANQDDCYSRFLISPSRNHSVAPGTTDPGLGFDIACGSLSGFGGFLHEDFRAHDYLLGRRNCQQFLRQHFCLPVTNKKVFNYDTAPFSSMFVKDNEQDCLAIIPLVGIMTSEEPLPVWPAKSFCDLDALAHAFDSRLRLVINRLVETVLHPNEFIKVAGELGLGLLRGKAVEKARQFVAADLTARNLYSSEKQ